MHRVKQEGWLDASPGMDLPFVDVLQLLPPHAMM